MHPAHRSTLPSRLFRTASTFCSLAICGILLWVVLNYSSQHSIRVQSSLGSLHFLSYQWQFNVVASSQVSDVTDVEHEVTEPTSEMEFSHLSMTDGYDLHAESHAGLTTWYIACPFWAIVLPLSILPVIRRYSHPRPGHRHAVRRR